MSEVTKIKAFQTFRKLLNNLANYPIWEPVICLKKMHNSFSRGSYPRWELSEGNCPWGN